MEAKQKGYTFFETGKFDVEGEQATNLFLDQPVAVMSQTRAA